MSNYVLADMDGEYSADPGDYFYLQPETAFDGLLLVKKQHAYRTTTGERVISSRVLKSDPTMRDLMRLQAVAS